MTFEKMGSVASLMAQLKIFLHSLHFFFQIRIKFCRVEPHNN